ncbi:MAG: hypothetical protein JXR96_16855 [Deltaproteobacteria bacterium]|nr:hypothetical protein [Deltaproteobacteria bacterium]
MERALHRLCVCIAILLVPGGALGREQGAGSGETDAGERPDLFLGASLVYAPASSPVVPG